MRCSDIDGTEALSRSKTSNTAKTKQKGEFKALNFFNSMGINCYVPSYMTKRVWSDRIKKVKVPAISGYVFFELNKISLISNKIGRRNIRCYLFD